MSISTRHVKYVFADVVRFTVKRTVEVQVEIVAALNAAFKKATSQFAETRFLPTGDGICAGIIDPTAPYHAHIDVALSVITDMNEWSQKQTKTDRKCKVRFGINEGVDPLILDINDHQNLAGAGINLAQRMMSLADGNQIIAGRAAYESLRGWDKYASSFRELRCEIKHGFVINGFQFIGEGTRFLSVKTPSMVNARDSIDIELAEFLSTENITAHPRGFIHAAEEWQKIRDELCATIKHRLKSMESEGLSRKDLSYCAPRIVEQLEAAETALSQFEAADTTFFGWLRSLIPGPKQRALSAEQEMLVVRARVLCLRKIVREWLESPEEKIDIQDE